VASKSVIMRVCDLHRESVASVKTVRFTWEGARHQLDLCTEHLGEVESTVNSWVRGTSSSTRSGRRPRKAAGAVKSGRPAKRAARRGSGSAAPNPSRELRVWAKANGYNVSDRGRIPSDVRTAYEAATK
jgi:Lsr2